MKIIAADYDETFFQHDYIDKRDLDAIDEWRAAGNLFGLNTARSYASAKREMNQWKFTADFMVCANGVDVFDKDENMISSTRFTHEQTHKHMHLMQKHQPSFSCILCDKEEYSVTPDGWGSQSYNTIISAKDMYKIVDTSNCLSAAFYCVEDRINYMNELKQLKESSDFDFEYEGEWVCASVRPVGFDKATGLWDYLKTLDYEVDPLDVFAYGDADSDAPAIAEFNGCTLPYGSKKAKEAARHIYANLAELVHDNL